MRPWVPHFLLLALAGTAAACVAMSGSEMDGSLADGPGGANPGGGGFGAGEADGSIDVASEGIPAAGPTNYANLCGLSANGDGADADRVCVAGAESDGCTSVSQSGGGMAPGYLACQLVADRGKVIPTCKTKGEGTYNQPCMTAENCTTGLGCAVVVSPSGGPDTGAACLDYCCGDVEECPQDTYCAPQAMAEASDLKIPVCILATKCTLLDDATCTDGLTCAIVRADGTTSCVKPGDGKDGEPCNAEGLCAAGFTCLKLVNTCKQLCRLDHPEDCPMGSTCLSGSGEYPDNYGTCTAGDGYN